MEKLKYILLSFVIFMTNCNDEDVIKDGIEGELIIVSPANQEWILSYLVPQSISDKIELSMSYGKKYDWSYKERYKCFNR